MEYQKTTLESGDIHWEKNLERREQIRGRVAGLINAEVDEVEFIPSTAAGMNIIAGQLSTAGRVIATTLEFPDTTLPWLAQGDDRLVWVEPDPDGAVPPLRFRERMTDDGGVIATSHVQYSNGFRQDLESLGRLKQNHRLVVNVTQSLGAFQVDVREMQIDALCGNSYKWMLSGYGCGVLYLSRDILKQGRGAGVGWFAVKDRDALANDRYELLEGAGRFNWGSPSFSTIFALGAGIDYLENIGIRRIESRVLELNRFLTDLLQRAGFRVLSPLSPSRYRSAEVLVELDEPERVVGALEERGILCTPKPEGMRVATHFFVSFEDVEQLVDALREVT